MELKKSWIVGALAVAIVVVLVVTVGPKISGLASYTPTEMDFPVFVDMSEGSVEIKGWNTCVNLDAGWDAVDSFCKSKEFAGALVAEDRPCLYEVASTRYVWDGSVDPMSIGAVATAGRALTKVKCASA